ncbi:MAG: Beta-1,3-glucosyltransferase [Candidatus Ruthia sp. Asou_11_S2]|nr:Beta-1,3-glucosyltransferase [Candidatus Ruthia sp. Asou_11_S2]
MKDIKVSVVIPMYNSQKTVKNTLDSVSNQTYQKNIEVLIINDGSSDDSRKIVEQYIKNNQHSNIQFRLINQENSGVSKARNKGIKKAVGNWIALLDSDDVWLVEKLEKQMSLLKKYKKIKFLGTNRNGEVYPFFNKAKIIFYSLNAKNIIWKWYPATPTAIVDKKILIEVGLYNENLKHGEDIDLWLRLINITPLYILNEDLVYTGNGKRSYGVSGLSNDLFKMHQGENFALKGAKKRKQINLFEYYGFYLWLLSKYIRRVVIIKIGS